MDDHRRMTCPPAVFSTSRFLAPKLSKEGPLPGAVEADPFPGSELTHGDQRVCLSSVRYAAASEIFPSCGRACDRRRAIVASSELERDGDGWREHCSSSNKQDRS